MGIMQRITKRQKEIVEAHLVAFTKDQFDINDCPETVEGLPKIREFLLEGKTFRNLHDRAESKGVSITSQLMSRPNVFGYISGAYRRDYTRAWKPVFAKLKIE